MLGEKTMRRWGIITILSVIILLCSGCEPIEWFLSDISGWNLSACVDGFNTCYELFMDNSDRILGGPAVVEDVLAEIEN